MVNLMNLLRVWALCFLCLLGGGAQALEVSGVRFDESIDFQGTRLLLNGAGTRYKLTFRVYAAGLYLGKKARTPEAVYADAGPKRLTLTMLRDVDADELGRLFIQGIRDNSAPAEYDRLLSSLLRMSQVFSDFKRVKVGDVITIDWVPGKGTVLHVRGQSAGEPIMAREFYAAMLRIWLGSSPADWQLKEALLGQSSKPGNGQPPL